MFDLVVIGAGPGGYIAAKHAAELGLKVACIDKSENLGGTCLNVGCIPSKTLLQTTEHYHYLMHQGQDFGMKWKELFFDFNALQSKKNEIISGLKGGVASLFKMHGVTFIEGYAEFISPTRLKVTTKTGEFQEIQATTFLIATGSEPISLPNLPFHNNKIVSSTGALNLQEIPKKLLVVGAGVIGIELASVYRRLDTEVQIIEMIDKICPSLDTSLSQSLFKTLQKQGIQISLSSRVVHAAVENQGVIVTADLNGERRDLFADVVLVAVGRKANTASLQLNNVGIETNAKGLISVDPYFCTAQPNIYAIGDVISGPMLAHRASAEAIAVVEFLKGNVIPVNYLAIANIIYTYPEVASVGLTEEEARQFGIDVMIGKSFFKSNARAHCMGETEGFVKLIGDKQSGCLVGMHIIGPFASEMIAEGMLAMQLKAKIEDLAYAPQAHPTLSETIKEAAQDCLKK